MHCNGLGRCLQCSVQFATEPETCIMLRCAIHTLKECLSSVHQPVACRPSCFIQKRVHTLNFCGHSQQTVLFCLFLCSQRPNRVHQSLANHGSYSYFMKNTADNKTKALWGKSELWIRGRCYHSSSVTKLPVL
jgi:hypothetical protein